MTGTLDELFERMNVPLISPDNQYVLVHPKLQPLIVRWIATLEKIRHGEQLDLLFNVSFNVIEDVVFENDEEILESRFDGVTFEPSDSDSITPNFRRSQAALKKLKEKR